MARKASTISNSANIMPGLNPAMVAHNLTKTVDKRSHYVLNYSGVVSLSVFGGNLILCYLTKSKVMQTTSL